MTLWPGDANEVGEAWRVIMEHRRDPAGLVLSRQAMPTLDRNLYAPATRLRRGAYILADPPSGAPEVILIGTGSEVALCVEAHRLLTEDGVRARLVSMPSWELFERQDAAYRALVLPHEVRARVAVEQGAGLGWERYVGIDGAVIAMRTFGASAPLKALLSKFGFTVDAVVAAARDQIAKAGISA